MEQEKNKPNEIEIKVSKESVSRFLNIMSKKWFMVLCVLAIFLTVLWYNSNTLEVVKMTSEKCNEHWKNQLKSKCPHLVWDSYNWISDSKNTSHYFSAQQEGGENGGSD